MQHFFSSKWLRLLSIGGILLSTKVLFALTNEAPASIEKITANLGANSVRLTWTPPSTPPNYPVSDYIIQYKEQAKVKYATANDGTNTKTGYLLQNLNPNTSYNLRIIAINSKGMSGYKVFRFTTKKSPTPGVCGSANEVTAINFPSSNTLCKKGTPSPTDTIGVDGIFNWVCKGINSTISATCQSKVAGGTNSNQSQESPRILLASPGEYTGQAGKKIGVNLFWEVFSDANTDYLQFMHLDNGVDSYSVDDHPFLYLWSSKQISDKRTITLPENISPGLYYILVGLSGKDPNGTWINYPLLTGTGVVNTGDNRYKVGKLLVSSSTGSTLSPSPTFTYSWSLGNWGACSLACGGGTQTRSITCMRSDGMKVADGYCSATKPAISESCNNQACTPVLTPSPSQSPNTLPTIKLASPQNYNAVVGTQETINLQWIRAPLVGEYLQFMHLDNGVDSYSVDDHWVDTSNWMGTAVDTRTITLPSTIPPGQYNILVGLSGGTPWKNIALIPATGVAQYPTNRYKVGTITITGTTPPLIPTPTPGAYTYTWSSGAWGTCSLACGGGNQARTVTCMRNDGQTVSDALCTGIKPTISQQCNTQVCTTNPGISSNVYGPRISNLTSITGPIYPKAGETISGKKISNPNGPCIVINEPNVTIKDNEIGPCLNSPESLSTPWGASPNGIGIQITAGSNIVIEFNKFDNVTSGVYASDGASHPIIIRHNTITNIRGPMPRGQFVQFNTVSGGNGQTKIYCNVSDVKGSSVEVVEDHINMYSSYGSTSPIEIAYNRIRGGHSVNGSGIMTGDSSAAGAGGGIHVHDNTIVEVANTGIGVAGGENIRIENNRVFMTGKYGPTRIGMYAYAYIPTGGTAPLCRNNSFIGNRVWAINTIDNTGSNPFWHDTSTCFNITDSGNTWGDSTLNEAIFNEIPQYCINSANGNAGSSNLPSPTPTPTPTPTPNPNVPTTINLASPQTYNAVAGNTKTMNLNWVRTPMGSKYLQFMHLDNGVSTYSIDDHMVDSTNWSGNAVDTRTVTIPSNVPTGKYDILVGLSGGNPWQNITLNPGNGVTNVGNNRYKVGTVNITGTTTTPTPTPTPIPPVTGNGTAAGPRTSTFVNSGPIRATNGQVISGLRITSTSGPCIVVSGVSNVIIRDNDFTQCGNNAEGTAVRIEGGATNTLVEHNRISGNIGEGITVKYSPGNTIRKNVFAGIRDYGEKYRHAIEVSWSDRSIVTDNIFSEGSYPSDILSGYEISDSVFTGNEFTNVSIIEPTGASFTIGDASDLDGTPANPGSNNYVARNKVWRQQGGVPAGVFGSTSNTVLEYNCFSAGVQAYNYSGIFNGVTLRNNVINQGSSFYGGDSGKRDIPYITGFDTNIDSTDCTRLQ